MLVSFANAQTLDWLDGLGVGLKVGIVLSLLTVSCHFGIAARNAGSMVWLIFSICVGILLAPWVLARLFPAMAGGAAGLVYLYKEAFGLCVTAILLALVFEKVRCNDCEGSFEE